VPMETTRMWKHFTTAGAQQDVNDHTEQDDARNKGTSIAVRGNGAGKQKVRARQGPIERPRSVAWFQAFSFPIWQVTNRGTPSSTAIFQHGPT
jgi:hypothetical protein